MSDPTEALLELTADIVTAYVGKNSIPVSDLPDLISQTYATLGKLGKAPDPVPSVALVPATSIRKSITPEYLICLDDGLKFKSLRRHLTTLGMTPDQYRRKWELPLDYPMIAPAYAERRSALAKSIGLGRKPKDAVAKPEPATKAKRARPARAA